MFRDLPRYQNTTANAFWSARTPSHWQMLPGLAVLEENCKKNDGLLESQVLSLSYGRVIVKPVEKQRGLVPDSYEGYQILGPGDIVIRPTDLQNDQTSIRVGHVQDRGIITSAYIGLRPRESWSHDYAYQYLTVVDSSKRIYGMGSGLRQQLGWPHLKRMPCLVPPADEQAAIARYLAHANARIHKAITAKRHLVALLEEQKTSTVTAAICAGWPRIPLKRALSSMTAGLWGAAPDESSETARWCVRVADFDYGAGRVADVPKTYRAISDLEFAPRSLQKGDLLLEGSGGGDKTPVGRVVLFDHDDPAVCSNFLQRIRPGAGVQPEFLSLILRDVHASGEIRRYIKQTTGIQNLDLGAYLSQEVPMPDLPAQRQAVSSVRAANAEADAVIVRATQEINLLQEFRTRLVADVVTGQVDIRAIASSLPDDPGPVVESAADEDEEQREIGEEGDE